MTATAAPERLSKGAWSWALYEGARNPYVMVCTIYIFAPYVANTVIGGGDGEGLKQIADLNKWAGFAVALTAPLIGAIADRTGRRKIPLAVVTAAMAMLVAAFWFITPDAPMTVWFPLMFAVALMFNMSEALHNAMLPGATSTAKGLSVASGLGLALGNAAGVLLLLFALLFLALPEQPLFGLDKAAHEPERITGPIVAVWLAIFAIPLFLYTADAPKGAPWRSAAREGLRALRGTIKRVRGMPNVARFLIARMLYADAKTAIIILGGVYISGVMGWGLAEMAAYGILLSLLAVAGGFLGGWLDGAVGPKRAIQIEIVMVAISQVLVVSIDRDTALFVIPLSTEPMWAAPMFKTAGELWMLAAVALSPVFITAAYASSRSLLALLAPPKMAGELFGLYALSGAATAWLGPMAVSVVTGLTGNPAAGVASLLLLLAAGFWVLRPLQEPARG